MAAWKHRGRVAWILFLCACAAAGAGRAADTQTLTVSARVREHVRLRVLSQPAHFDVTDEDIRRRYVDVVQPLQVEVTTNVTRGLSMHFMPQDPAIRGAHARGLVRVGGKQHGLHSERVEVFLRLDLEQGARAGRHAWSIEVGMEPL